VASPLTIGFSGKEKMDKEFIYTEEDMQIASNALHVTKSELKSAREMIYALIKSSGGEIKVSYETLIDIDDTCVVTKHGDPSSMNWIFKVKERSRDE
jgi:hypothetical protein